MEGTIKHKSGERGWCEGCERTLRIFRRGICERCYRDPKIRKLFKTLRQKERTLDVETRNDILMNPNVVSQALLRHVARGVAKKFIKRVEVCDLVQVGWVVLLESVDRWYETREREERAKSLIHYCLRGMVSRMYIYAQRLVNLGLVEHDDKISVKHHGLRGGLLDRDYRSWGYGDETSQELAITWHALTRYQDRFNPLATSQDVRNRVRESCIAPPQLSQYLTETRRNNADMFTVLGDAVFCILTGSQHRGVLRPVVLSVLDINSIDVGKRKWRKGRELALAHITPEHIRLPMVARRESDT